MRKKWIICCLNGHIFTGRNEPVSNELDKYCPSCGTSLIHQCPNCDADIVGGGREIPEEGLKLPDYCYDCGEAYPWVSPVEAEKQREEDFLQIDDSELNGHFYPGLVYEINLCYQVKADQATLVLTRKLIENLIVDSLRKAFTMDEVELFYDTDNRRTLPLSELLDNMKERRKGLNGYSAGIDEELFRKIDELKYRGDASAHSIEEDASNIDMKEKSELATEVAKVLFRLRQETATAHRDR